MYVCFAGMYQRFQRYWKHTRKTHTHKLTLIFVTSFERTLEHINIFYMVVLFLYVCILYILYDTFHLRVFYMLFTVLSPALVFLANLNHSWNLSLLSISFMIFALFDAVVLGTWLFCSSILCLVVLYYLFPFYTFHNCALYTHLPLCLFIPHFLYSRYRQQLQCVLYFFLSFNITQQVLHIHILDHS